MRVRSGILMAGALFMLPAFSHSGTDVSAAAAPAPEPAAAGQAAAAAPQGQALTFDGEIALWSMAIKEDKTADFEQVMGLLKAALLKSEKPETKAMAAGWKIMRGGKDGKGNIVYTHVINPVVKGADYRILQNIYAVTPDNAEQKKAYEAYAGAFGGNLGASVGTVVADFSK
jgi:hypothetical protein